MLLVILGAGASFDSSFDSPVRGRVLEHRPPLANDLFHSRYVYVRRQFPQLNGILAELAPYPGRSLEDVLTRLRQQASGEKTRESQLAAVRFYLKALLTGISTEWPREVGGVTNYNALIHQISNSKPSADPCCLVTFNYDTLLDSAIVSECGGSISSLADYTSRPDFRLFKLHGSTNWGQMVASSPANLVWDPKGMIDAASRVTFHDQIVMEGQYSGPALYPAIAVPTTDKREFVCPREHVGILSTLIPKVTKILTIGWRGSEEHFLSMLRVLAGRPVDVVTIAGDEDQAIETLETVRSTGIAVMRSVALAGFSDSIAGGSLRGFFSPD